METISFKLLGILLLSLSIGLIQESDYATTKKTGIYQLSQKNGVSADHAKQNPESRLNETIKLLCDSLKIENVTKGYNGLQIRVWLSNRLRGLNQQVILLIEREGEKNVLLYNFTPHYKTARMQEIAYFDKELIDFSNRQRWDSMFLKIEHLRIKFLPENNGKDYSTHYDDESVTIEFAQNNFYRIFNYSSSNRAGKHGDSNAKKIVKLLQIIKQYSGIKYIQGFEYIK
jgi:hypothetical protein